MRGERVSDIVARAPDDLGAGPRLEVDTDSPSILTVDGYGDSPRVGHCAGDARDQPLRESSPSGDRADGRPWITSDVLQNGELTRVDADDVIITIGIAALVAADWLILAELALVAVTGTAMGYVTHFRSAGSRLQYRLTGVGLILWAAFVAIRVGNFGLANLLGANLAEATGLILLSFGVNRWAAIAVVRRRAKAHFGL